MRTYLKFIIVILTFSSVTMVSCNKQKDGIKPTFRNLTEAVYSTVTVEPKDMYTVFPAVSGIIDKKLIEEGDTISMGQIMFQLVNTQSTINSKSADLQYEIAKETYSGETAVLKELSESIASARLKLANDSLNYYKQKRLWDQKIGSEQAFQDRKLMYEYAQNELNKLLNNYARTKKELANKMELARNTYSVSKINNRDFTITSKMEGIVYEVLKEEGESVNPQTAMAIIGSADDFILKLLIDEVDIARVFEGQEVTVLLDAYGKEVFKAKITKIAPSMNLRSQTFEIEAQFVDSPPRLFYGLTGEGNIVIQKKDNILTVPTTYISGGKVLTEKGDKPVKIGLQSLKYTEIIEGIDSSTVIYKFE